jgi:hypothetical protein
MPPSKQGTPPDVQKSGVFNIRCMLKLIFPNEDIYLPSVDTLHFFVIQFTVYISVVCAMNYDKMYNSQW